MKERLEKALEHPTWRFDCPICGGTESVVAELDDGKLDTRTVVTGRCACVQCGFIVRKGEPFLSEIVLTEQISAKTPDILKELGIEN